MDAHRNYRLFTFFIWLIVPNAFSKGGSRGMSSARASVSSRFPFTNSRSSQFSSQLFSSSVNSGAFYRSPSLGSTQFIINPTVPVILNSRPYFWGTSYYESHVNNSKICTVLLNTTDDDKLMTLQFENGTKPTEIVYGCQDWEYCSDFDCENIIGNIIKIALVSLLAALLFAYIIYRIKRNQRMSRKAIATTTVAQTYSTKTQVSRTQTQSSEVADGCKENKQTTETQKPPEANVESVRKLRPPGGRLPPLEKPS